VASDATTLLVVITDLSTYREATSGPMAQKWLLAMDTEFSSLRSNNMWTLYQLPKGRWAIRTKWVYKTKLKENGEIDCLKARLVAKGFT
jgi:hypothetical protein